MFLPHAASHRASRGPPRVPAALVPAREEGTVNSGLRDSTGQAPHARQRANFMNLLELEKVEKQNTLDADARMVRMEAVDAPKRGQRGGSGGGSFGGSGGNGSTFGAGGVDDDGDGGGPGPSYSRSGSGARSGGVNTFLMIEQDLAEFAESDDDEDGENIQHAAENKMLEDSLDRLARLVASGYAPQLKHMVWLFRALTRDSLPRTLAQRVYDMLMAVHHSFPLSHAPWFVVGKASTDSDAEGSEDDDDGDDASAAAVAVTRAGPRGTSGTSGTSGDVFTSPFVWKGVDLHAGEKDFSNVTKLTVSRLHYILRMRQNEWKYSHFLVRFYASVFADELEYLRDLKRPLTDHTLRRILKNRGDSNTMIELLGRYIRDATGRNDEGAFRSGLTFFETFVEVFGTAQVGGDGELTWEDAQSLMVDVASIFHTQDDEDLLRIIRALRAGSFKIGVLFHLLARSTEQAALNPDAAIDGSTFSKVLFGNPLLFIEHKCSAICRSRPPVRNRLKGSMSQERWAAVVCEMLHTMQALLVSHLSADGKRVQHVAQVARVAMLELCDDIESAEDNERKFFFLNGNSGSESDDGQYGPVRVRPDRLRAKFELARATLFDF